MAQRELPDDVRRFLLSSVPSVPYLEAVLLLRAEPAVGWDAHGLARRLYVPERTAAELIGLLRRSGIAEAVGDDTLRYAPSPELRQVIDRTAAAYAANLVAITDMIHSRIDRRAQQFADAFRFRKE